MANQNENQIAMNEAVDLGGLEKSLTEAIESQVSDLDSLTEELQNIGNPEQLGKVVMDTVWEQLMNNMGSVAGEDFIKENGNMTLDLSKDAHIQTTDNFADGKIASHNKEINYQERYDNWQGNFEKDKSEQIKYHSDRTGKQKENLVKGARKKNDEGRPKGSKEKGMDMDHTVSAGEIIRDPKVAAHLTEQEKINFANSSSNLNEMNSSHNRSKSDLSMKEWLETPNANGQKPKDIFNDLDDETIKSYYEKDMQAREKWGKTKNQGEQSSIESGKKSRREEAFKVGKAAVGAVAMSLLAAFIKEVVKKFIKWLSSKEKTLENLLANIKAAISSFVKNLGQNLLSAGQTLATTIATAIFGPITRTFTKAFTMLKQGMKSVADAIAYIRKPENRKKSLSILVAEVGKIIVVGLSAVGALALNDVIEKGLMAIPPLAIEIPLFGSLASILGLATSGLIAGLIGAMVLNYIDKWIAQKRKAEATVKIIEKQNEILQTQEVQKLVVEEELVQTKERAFQNIADRHTEARKIMKETLANVFEEPMKDVTPVEESDNKKDLDELQRLLEGLL